MEYNDWLLYNCTDLTLKVFCFGLVLPKYDVTVNAPQVFSVGDVGLKVAACAK